MSTGDRFVNILPKKLLGFQDFDDRLLRYFKKLIRDTNSTVYGQNGFFDTTVTVSPNGTDKFQLDSDALATDGIGNLLLTDAESSGRDSGISFENQTGENYFIALNSVERPVGIQINPRTGQPEFQQLEEVIGELGEPSSVTDNGTFLSFNIDSIAKKFTPEDNDLKQTGRTCLVWKVAPGSLATTEALAIESTTVTYPSVNNVINTTGLLGQTAGNVTLDPSQYRVLLLGPTVSLKDLTGETGMVFVGKIVGNGPGATPSAGVIGDQNSLSSAAFLDFGDFTTLINSKNRIEVVAKASDSPDTPQVAVKNDIGTTVFSVDEDGDTLVGGDFTYTGSLFDIDATTEIELTAPTIDVDGTTTITLDTPTLDINASTLAEIDAPTVDITGSTLASVNSSTEVDITAPTVDINGATAVDIDGGTVDIDGTIINITGTTSQSLVAPTITIDAQATTASMTGQTGLTLTADTGNAVLDATAGNANVTAGTNVNVTGATDVIVDATAGNFTTTAGAAASLTGATTVDVTATANDLTLDATAGSTLVSAGTEVDLTAPTVDINGATAVDIDGGIITVTPSSSLVLSNSGGFDADLNADNFDIDAVTLFDLLAPTVDITGSTLASVNSSTEVDITAPTVDINGTGGAATVDITGSTLASVNSSTEVDITAPTVDINATTGAATVDVDAGTVTIDSSSGGISLTTSFGDTTLSPANNAVINASNDVNITGANDIAIDATNATLTIDSGTSMSITGGSTLGLTATSVATLTGGTGLNLNATTGNITVDAANGNLNLQAGTDILIDGNSKVTIETPTLDINSATITIDSTASTTVSANNNLNLTSTASNVNITALPAGDVAITAGSNSSISSPNIDIDSTTLTEIGSDVEVDITAPTVEINANTGAATVTIDTTAASITGVLNVGSNLDVDGTLDVAGNVISDLIVTGNDGSGTAIQATTGDIVVDGSKDFAYSPAKSIQMVLPGSAGNGAITSSEQYGPWGSTSSDFFGAFNGSFFVADIFDSEVTWPIVLPVDSEITSVSIDYFRDEDVDGTSTYTLSVFKNNTEIAASKTPPTTPTIGSTSTISTPTFSETVVLGSAYIVKLVINDTVDPDNHELKRVKIFYNASKAGF